jgi:hypothetical protein
MSEAFPAVKPWEWLQVCEFWPDRAQIYLNAKEEARPHLEALQKQRQEEQAERERQRQAGIAR